jgi:hypothetical protein
MPTPPPLHAGRSLGQILPLRFLLRSSRLVASGLSLPAAATPLRAPENAPSETWKLYMALPRTGLY